MNRPRTPHGFRPSAAATAPIIARPTCRLNWVALALAAAAVLVRLPHLGWGLPDLEEEAFPLKKAFQMWGWDDGGLQLDPRTAGWPSLSFYVHLLLQHLVYLGGRLSGAFANRYDFWLLQDDLMPLVLAARALGVLAAGGTVYVAVRLGARLAGMGGGLIAGGVLAVSPLLFEQSRLITPDILLTLFAALAVSRIVDIHEHGALRDYIWAGIWIGLGISTKYSPILLAPALYVVHWRRHRLEARTVAAGAWTLAHRLGFADRRLLAAATACIASFALTSPFLLRDLTIFQKDFTSQVAHMSQGHFGHEARGGLSLYYLRDVLAPALGWPGLVAAVGGLVWAFWRRRSVWLVPAVCVACLYVGLSSLRTQFDRYMLPLLLPLALGLAGTWLWLEARIRGFAVRAPRRWGPALTSSGLVLFALAVLVPPAVTSARLLRQQGRPSTLQAAKRYFVETLGEHELTYAMEPYTPLLPRDRRRELAQQPAFARLTPAQRQRLLDGPAFQVVIIPMYSGLTGLSDFYYDLRHYLPIDIIVTSSAVRGRYERNPERYGRQIQFYRDLDTYAECTRAFAPDAKTRGPEIRVYRFGDDGRARLLRERRRVEAGFYREFDGRLHAPHFHAFLDGIGNAAYQKQMYDIAERYFQALDETTAPEADRPWLPGLAAAKLETGQPAEARDLCRELLRRDPQNYQAEAMLATALEALGDLPGAIQHYERCALLADEIVRGRATEPGDTGPERFAAWARDRLQALLPRPGAD